MTPEQAERLSMEAWMRLPEREQNMIVSAYCGKTKHCNQCGADHPLDRAHFYLYADGTPRTPCRACQQEKARERNKAARERHEVVPPPPPPPRPVDRAPVINGRRQYRRAHGRDG
jgi:hypothetical protein